MRLPNLCDSGGDLEVERANGAALGDAVMHMMVMMRWRRRWLLLLLGRVEPAGAAWPHRRASGQGGGRAVVQHVADRAEATAVDAAVVDTAVSAAVVAAVVAAATAAAGSARRRAVLRGSSATLYSHHLKNNIRGLICRRLLIF